MDALLQYHELTLRALFRAFSSEDISFVYTANDKERTEEMRMSLEDWETFHKAFWLVDKDISQQAVVQSFVWSRMRVINEHSKGGQRKLTGLSFQDFLEAFGLE